MQELGTGDTREKPIKLGGALFTMVEPHRGHEVAYNRWYERDHFYAGCMIGAWTLAGTRFVATRDCKAKRFPADSPVCPDPTSGSYLALYWVLKGRFGDWIQWGTEQVKWLHANDRMFPHRDHVHTLMYRFRLEEYGKAEAVPTELALDHRFPYLVAVIGEVADGASLDDVDVWFANRRPRDFDVMVEMTPVPLLADAPSDVPRDTAENRFLQLYFTHADVLDAWDADYAPIGPDLEASGLGRILFASPFRATHPGTDDYTDQLH